MLSAYFQADFFPHGLLILWKLTSGSICLFIAHFEKYFELLKE